jgi:Bacterial SH3 domain
MARDKNMRKIVRLGLGLGVSIAFVAPALAELAMTGEPVAMRAGPTGKAGVVELIPQSAEIHVEKCAGAWCRASWRGRLGYVPVGAVALRSPPTTLPGDKMPPPVVNGASTDATRPAWRWTGPYVGVNGGVGSGSW